MAVTCLTIVVYDATETDWHVEKTLDPTWEERHGLRMFYRIIQIAVIVTLCSFVAHARSNFRKVFKSRNPSATFKAKRTAIRQLTTGGENFRS